MPASAPLWDAGSVTREVSSVFAVTVTVTAPLPVLAFFTIENTILTGR